MRKTNLSLSLASLFALLALPASATTLFFDDFNGTGDLNGTTPDTTTGGSQWVANTSFFKANGVFGGAGRGSATLAFTPVDGFIYSAETWISASSGIFYAAMGFANGETTGGTAGAAFERSGGAQGRAWMQYQIDAQGSPTGNSQTYTSLNSDGADWTSFATNKGGAIGMRVDLDTTGGAGNWTATYFAKENAVDAWTQVRASVALPLEDINSVGFSAIRGGTNFTVDSFTVTAIPEPSAAALILLAGLSGLFVHRRRR